MPISKTTTELDAEVYQVTAQIPRGRVITYGEIAHLIGMPNHARWVGKALGAAPDGIPCHRVVGSGGRLTAHWPEQRTLLEKEGVVFRANGCVDLRQSGWEAIRKMVQK